MVCSGSDSALSPCARPSCNSSDIGRVSPFSARSRAGRSAHPRPVLGDAVKACTETETVLGRVATGIDPVAEQKAQLVKAFTVSEPTDRYLTQHVEMKNKPRTQKEFRRLVEVLIKPQIGSRAVESITRGDIPALHHHLRCTPRQANMCLSVLSKMFILAEVWGFRRDGSNRCRLIERYKETARERFLSDAEALELGKALAIMDNRRETPDSVIAAVRLLFLTG